MTKKERSREHEEYIARIYDGRRSKTSGASDTDKGDVRARTLETLFECKVTGEPGEKEKRTTVIKHMEKVADEAWAEGLEPAVCLRYWHPSSPLAGPEGWVDLTVRLTANDCVRERLWLSS